MRILVAEDDTQNREIIRRLLERLSAEVVTARDGAEAVERFERDGAFDLVLLDLSMPGSDGYMAAGAMRDIERRRGRPRSPIIALSGSDDSPSIGQAGFDGFVQKPVGSASLREILDRWARGGTG
ncbi:MAG TPA: response regulator [Rectinemataceae bacterium]|nr:response regulator [Rectinemataceae bacterium]